MIEVTIKELINKIDSFKWNHLSYVEKGDITFDTLCIILDENEEEVLDDNFTFKIVAEKNYVEFLGIADIRDIFDNLSQQIENPIDDLKLEALIFYFETDCFLEVNPET